jgi:hypothetical protein
VTAAEAEVPPGLDDVGVSVVLPCLNEAPSVGRCVAQALDAIRATGLTGEVVVCDNGSTDGSAEIARRAGARVVHESARGYGSAYLRGFAAARGTYLVMGDADASYDFGEIPNLISMLEAGYDYVVGSRFAGKILPGAMPWTHRYVGNPMLTGVLNRLFGTRFSDAHSGLRAMRRTAYERLTLRSTGMELASEISVRAAQTGLRSAEIPITYHPRAGSSKLRPLQDGWRHLRFLVSMVPGLTMMACGLLAMLLAVVAVVLVQPSVLGANPVLALHLTILFTLMVLVGAQVLVLGATAHLHWVKLSTDGRSQLSRSIERTVTSPLLHLLGSTVFALGLAAEIVSLLTPHQYGTGHLRFTAIALTTMVLGVQVSIAAAYLARLQGLRYVRLPVGSEPEELVAVSGSGPEEDTPQQDRLSL